MAQTTTGGGYFDVLSCSQFSPPAGCITNAAVIANAQIDATKLQQQGAGMGTCKELVAPGTAVTANTGTIVFKALATGTLAGFAAWVETPATGADRQITLDLKSAAPGSSTFTSVLTAVITIDNTALAGTEVAAAITTPAYVAGTRFKVVTTVAGASGAQATGLSIRLTPRENSQ